MTYGELARRQWGNFYFAWLRGWNREQLRPRASEHEEQAYNAGRKDRREAGQVEFDMLTDKGAI